jgi:hypothetical protein
MVYRLAELRQRMDSGSDAEDARRTRLEHDELIMALWANRKDVPGGVAARRHTAPGVAIVEALPGEHAWPSLDEPIVTVFDVLAAMTRSVKLLAGQTAVLLFHYGEMGEGPLDPDLPLEEGERETHDRLLALREILVQRASVAARGADEGELPAEKQGALLEQGLRDELDRLTALAVNLWGALNLESEEAGKAAGPSARRRKKPGRGTVREK